MVLPTQGPWLNALKLAAQTRRPTLKQAEKREVDIGGSLLDYVTSNTKRVKPRSMRSTDRYGPTPLMGPRQEAYTGARWWPDHEQQTPMSEFGLRAAQLGRAEERVWIHDDWEKRKQRYTASGRTLVAKQQPLRGVEVRG
jgi:hypothetical protein